MRLALRDLFDGVLAFFFEVLGQVTLIHLAFVGLVCGASSFDFVLAFSWNACRATLASFLLPTIFDFLPPPVSMRPGDGKKRGKTRKQFEDMCFCREAKDCKN